MSTNEFVQAAPYYDYGIINFIKPINKLRVTADEQPIDTLYGTFSNLSKTVDDLFGQIERTNGLEIPSGLHSLLDKVVASQTDSPIPQDIVNWSNKIAHEHFGD
jgi:hypothetical protein